MNDSDGGTALSGAALFGARLDRAHESMGIAGVDVVLLSLGADLPWLTGYPAMPLERLTMLVVPPVGAQERPVLFVPELEAPRVKPVPEVFEVQPWAETEDPVALVASRVKRSSTGSPVIAISDRAWATFVLQLQQQLPGATWKTASEIMAPLRAIKDAAEVEALAKAASAADRVADALLGGEIALVGRTEREVSAEITRRLLEEGHQRVGFAIVASGPNSSSPHHEPSERTIGKAEAVVCDFGGSLDGYCSDMTRTVFTGPPSKELAKIYGLVAQAQAAGVVSAEVGQLCSAVDWAARRVITDAGYGQYFVHRTGHGIGLEEHEDPYMVAGNSTPVTAGNVFSVEPGIYVPHKFGVRIEDIVAATERGPRPLNQADHALTVVEA
ncbi:MAG TPA: Xaa-Pro peptidase family protein [Acidimicrobiales bacterium]|nr:Xaa-Pro peptidase family protein [Acidimicrobiales bacterium]